MGEKEYSFFAVALLFQEFGVTLSSPEHDFLLSMSNVSVFTGETPIPSDGRPMSREIIESYIFVEARRDLGIYGERLMLRLMESCQKYIYGLNFKDGTDLRQVEIGPWGEAKITIPVRDLLFGDDDRNYNKAKAGIRTLMSKFLEYDNGTRYFATQILNEADMNTLSGRIIIEVNKNVWSAMLSFSKGYRLVDLETALKLRSRYAMRLLPMVCRQSDPITYSIAELREQWELKGKYPNSKDFIRNTVAAAKEELDRVSPWTFDYVLNSARSAPENAGKTGRLKVTSVTFFPKHQLTREAPKRLVAQITPSLVLSAEELRELKETYGFTSDGLQANLYLLDLAKKNTDLMSFLRVLRASGTRARNPQGYVIGALRKHLEELGVDPNEPES